MTIGKFVIWQGPFGWAPHGTFLRGEDQQYLQFDSKEQGENYLASRVPHHLTVKEVYPLAVVREWTAEDDERVARGEFAPG